MTNMSVLNAGESGALYLKPARLLLILISRYNPRRHEHLCTILSVLFTVYLMSASTHALKSRF